MDFYRLTDEIRIDIDEYWAQVTYAEADTYMAARGNAAWTGPNDEKSQALQRAWDYLKNLSWVESAFYDYVGTPADVKAAQILLGLEELKSPGVLSPALTRDNYVSSSGLGSGAISKSYRSDAPAWKRFRGVEMILGPYVRSVSNIRLERG